MKTVPYERLSSSIEPLKNYFERSNNYEFKFFFKIRTFSLLHRLSLDHYYYFIYHEGLITTPH